jgi:hypothetical protein
LWICGKTGCGENSFISDKAQFGEYPGKTPTDSPTRHSPLSERVEWLINNIHSTDDDDDEILSLVRPPETDFFHKSGRKRK